MFMLFVVVMPSLCGFWCTFLQLLFSRAGGLLAWHLGTGAARLCEPDGNGLFATFYFFTGLSAF